MYHINKIYLLLLVLPLGGMLGYFIEFNNMAYLFIILSFFILFKEWYKHLKKTHEQIIFLICTIPVFMFSTAFVFLSASKQPFSHILADIFIIAFSCAVACVLNIFCCRMVLMFFKWIKAFLINLKHS